MLQSTTECYVRDAQAFMSWIAHFKGDSAFEGNNDIDQYLAHLQTSNKDCNNSVRRKLISLKQFFRFIFNDKLGQSSPVDMIPIPARDENLPDCLDQFQVEHLISLASSNPSKFKALRDRAMCSLLMFEGIKAAEIIAIKWGDFISDPKRTGSLKITGSKSRIINLTMDTVDSLVAYKRHLQSEFNNHLSKCIWMFSGIIGRSGLPATTPISRHGIKFLLYDLGKAIGVEKLNTELLRHYAIDFHLGLGKSPEEIMEHFGLKQAGIIGKHARIMQPKPGANSL